MPDRIDVNTERDPWSRFGTCNYPNLVNDTSTQQSRLAEVKAMGLKWMRTDFHWSVIEPSTKGTFVWTQPDLLVANGIAAGVNILPILCYSVNWANGQAGDNTVPPLNSQDYADYCAAVVNRYYPLGVTHYELWNEPNIQVFWNKNNGTGVDPEKYYEMLRLACIAIKGVQPRAKVILGATTLSTLTENTANHVSANYFLQAGYDAGCKDYFDIFAYHPYDWMRAGTSNATDNVIAECRRIMVANGDGHKKMWFTEYGRPTGGNTNFSTEQSQAQQFTDCIRLMRKLPYVEKMFFYTFKDFAVPSDTEDREDHYGMVRSDGSFKPSYYAVRDTIIQG